MLVDRFTFETREVQPRLVTLFAVLSLVSIVATGQVIPSLIAVTIMWAISYLGYETLRLLGVLPANEHLGALFGLTVGVAIFTLVHVVMVKWLNPNSSVVVVLISATALALARRRAAAARVSFKSHHPQTKTAFLVCGCYFINASLDYSWYIGLAILCFTLFAIIQKAIPSPRLLACVAAIALAIFLGTYITRPRFWYLQQEEQLLHSLIATSLSSLPPSTALWSLDTDLNYHWFSFPIVGVLSRAAGFTDFGALSIFLPIVYGTFLFVGVLGVLQSVTGRRESVIALVVAAATSSVGFAYTDFRLSATSLGPTTLLSSLCGIALIYLAAAGCSSTSESSTSTWRCGVGMMLVSSLLSFAMVGSKIDFAAPIVAAVLLLAAWQIIKFRRDLMAVSLQAAVIIGVATGSVCGAIAVVGIFDQASWVGGQTSELLSPNLEVLSFWGDVRDLNGIPRTAAAIAIFSGLLSVTLLVSIQRRMQRPLLGQLHTLHLVLMVICAIAMVIIHFPSSPNQLTFLRSALLLSIPLGALYAVESLSLADDWRSHHLQLVLTGLVTGALWLVHFGVVNLFEGDGSIWAIAVRVSRFVLPPIQVTFGAAIFATIGSMMQRSSVYTALNGMGSQRISVSRWREGALVAVLVSGVMLGLQANLEAFRFGSEKLEARGLSYMAGTEVRRVAREIRRESDGHGLVAVDRPVADLQIQQLVALSDRQFLTIGDSWGFRDSRTAVGARNMELSRSINYLSISGIERLCQADVRTVVVRNLQHVGKLKGLLGSPLIETKNFAVFPLRSCST